jgi:succinoglycan biosynthesis transport protein ExoP
MTNMKRDLFPPRKRRPAADGKPRINPFRILWRYPGLIASCTLLAAGLGYVLFLTRPPTFQASAKVFVSRRMPTLAFDSAATSASLSSALEQMLFTHAQLIQNEVVLGVAAKNPMLSGADFPSTPEGRVAKLKEGVSVVRPRANNQVIPGFLEIVYTSTNWNEPVVAVRAITAAYSEYLRQSEVKEISEAVDLISKASESLDRDVLAMQTSYNDFLVRNQLSLRDAKGEILNVQVEHLREAELKLLKLKERQRDYKQKVKTLEAAAAKQDATPAALAFLIRREGMLGDVERQGSEDGISRSEAQARLFNLRLKERELLDRLGPDHPNVKTLRDQMDILIPLAAPNARSAALDKAKDPNTLIQEYLESLRIDLAVLDDQIQESSAVVIKERPRLEAFSKLQLEERQRRDAITSKKSLFDAAVKRLEELRISREDNSTRAQIVSEPELTNASQMSLWRFIFGGAVLGFAIGFALSVLREMTMNCFRTPDEIHEDLGVQALAHIPPMTHSLRSPRKGGVAGSIVTLSKPRSRHAEAFRALRTNLLFLHQEDHQVLQVTSPLPGDGKTTVAVNLAVSIAQSGKSVLLIDADMRRPKVAEVLDVPESPGLSEVLQGKLEVEAAIARLEQAPGLDILSAGDPIANPCELLTQPTFPELLEQLRREYDYVVVDSPPILAVSDPAVIAPRSDGVLVVLRIKRNSRDLANRSFELLKTVNAPIIGVVANTFSRDGSDLDYGYGQYVYGRGKYAMFAYKGYRQTAAVTT